MENFLDFASTVLLLITDFLLNSPVKYLLMLVFLMGITMFIKNLARR